MFFAVCEQQRCRPVFCVSTRSDWLICYSHSSHTKRKDDIFPRCLINVTFVYDVDDDIIRNAFSCQIYLLNVAAHSLKGTVPEKCTQLKCTARSQSEIVVFLNIFRQSYITSVTGLVSNEKKNY